jgi:hypothetical protein
MKTPPASEDTGGVFHAFTSLRGCRTSAANFVRFWHFLALRAKMNVTEGHFYTDNGQIPVSNLAALKAL